MTSEPTLDLLASHHHAVLGTMRRDGGVQLSPVLAVKTGPASVAISSREAAMKTKNLRRTPSAFLCVFPDNFFGEWIQIDGIATIHSLPEALERLVDYYRLAAGEHQDWDAYRASMLEEQRVLIEIAVTHIGPTISG